MDISGSLSPLAACAYLATSGAALIAAWRAPADRRRRVAVRNWIAVAAIFVALAVWRLGEGEARVQARVRGWANSHGVYDDRYSVQGPVTVAAILAIIALVWLARRASGAGLSGQALSVALIMGVFTAVRATSLHAVDALLYHSIGPVHINYLIDLGLTAVVAMLAVADWRRVAVVHKTRRRRRSSSRSHGTGPRGPDGPGRD